MVKAHTGSSRHLSRLLFLVLVVLLAWRIGVNMRHNLLDRQLIAAVKARNLAAVGRLLEQGADPLTKYVGKGNMHTTVLEIADYSTTPDDRLVGLLLDHTTQANPRGDDGAEVLRAAAFQGRNDVVRRLLDHGANIDSIDTKSQGDMTLLNLAIEGGHVDTVRLLLDRGAAEYYRKHNGLSSPLFLANKEIIRLLVDRGFDANTTTPGGMPLLVDIAEQSEDDVVTVRMLLQHGARVNARIPAFVSPVRVEGKRVLMGGWSSLLAAIRSRNLAIAEMLIGSGADVNAADAEGVTPLIAAGYRLPDLVLDPVSHRLKRRDAHAQAEMRRKSRNLVSDLLAHGAKVNAVDQSGRSPLVYALASSQPEIVRVLLQRGASVDVLAGAARVAPSPVLRFLLDRGARIDARDPTGNTALINAANRNDLDCAALLLARGAQVEARNAVGNTALLSAIVQMNDIQRYTMNSGVRRDVLLKNIIRLLLTHGANVNAHNRDGATALMLAAGTTGVGPDIVQLLLDQGADLRAEDNRGKNTLFYAAESGHTDTLKLLLSRGLSINSRDHRGETPLLSLLKGQYIAHQTIAALLASGADVNAQDVDGRTPLKVALRRRYWKPVDQLRQAGAHE